MGMSVHSITVLIMNTGERPDHLTPPVDTSDVPQKAALGALGHVIDQAIEDLGQWHPDEPTFLLRTSFQLVGHVLQLMSTARHLLVPGEDVFTYASGVSLCLRALCDIHARQLAIWDATSPESRLEGMLADSRRQELLGLDSAEKAGSPTNDLREVLSRLAGAEGSAQSVNVTQALEEREEWEMLCVYRWESGHVHLGAAAIAAGGRTITQSVGQMDVAMVPVTLWRVGQLTWTAYGVGLRALSHITNRMSIDTPNLAAADDRVRAVAKAAALGLRSPDEPPSPHYGLFNFPLWGESES
jgi:hypothetical protein